jgi:hypothetical protein
MDRAVGYSFLSPAVIGNGLEELGASQAERTVSTYDVPLRRYTHHFLQPVCEIASELLCLQRGQVLRCSRKLARFRNSILISRVIPG